MKKKFTIVFLLLVLLGIKTFSTSTSTVTRAVLIDGTVGSLVANGTNGASWENDESLVGNLTTWYMSWDNSNLYIGRVGGNNAEPILIYIQAEYVGATYTATPQTYDNFTPDFSNMTGVNFVAYLKSDYDEFRTWNGTAWSAANNSLTPVYTPDMEVSIPWTSISANNGMPSNFRIVFYQTNGNPSSIFAYGESPSGNPDGALSSPIISNWWGGLSVSGGVAPNGTSDAPLPVELTSFSANILSEGVQLNWTTATEVDNYGFSVERKSSFAKAEWETIGFVQGHGNSNSPKEYSFLDNGVTSGKYAYRLKQIDTDGAFEYSNIIEVDVELPTKYELFQNYPNPFSKGSGGNPATTIAYSLPEAQRIRLAVFNVLGEEVALLVNEKKEAGKYNITFDAANLPSGLYLYSLQTENFSQTKKMMLLK